MLNLNDAINAIKKNGITGITNQIVNADCLEVMKQMPDNSVDSIVTDPPAGIGFMGKEWDSDKGGRNEWIKWLSEVMAESLRVLKPGGHAFVWALPRTSHWTGTALENAGFEVRDCVYHLFGSGFPKSLNIGKAVDKLQGNEREEFDNPLSKKQTGQKGTNALSGDRNDNLKISKGTSKWEGWGTALKPAVECWWLVRKPLSEKTVAENVLKHGTGGINIDGSRVGTEERYNTPAGNKAGGNSLNMSKEGMPQDAEGTTAFGRFPANLIHDGSDVILKELNDEARFFYTAKPSSSEKNLMYGEFEEKVNSKMFRTGNNESENISKGFERFDTKPAKNFHPTVKAQSLMQYLIRLITPPKGIVLDMFAGSGSTCLAAKNTGFRYIGIEIDPEYCKIAEARLKQGVLDF